MEEQEGKGRQVLIVRWTIILVAAAVFIFAAYRLYKVDPIVIYNIQSTASPAPQSSEAQRAVSTGETAASASKTAEQPAGEVLVAKSIDINRAGQEELEKLPGIGPVLAERIIRYREANDGFLDIEELMFVDGIGERVFQKIQDYIFVEEK